MKKANIYMNVFLMALSVLFFTIALKYPYNFKGTAGPGVFPIWLSVGLFVLSGVDMLKTLKNSKGENGEPFFADKTARNRVIIFYISLLVFVAAINILGVYIATFLYCVWVYRIFDKFTWKATLPTAVGVCLFVCLVFYELLQLRLPMGFWAW